MDACMRTYLCPEIVLWLVAENVDGRNIQMHEDVLERGTVPGLGSPALFDQKLEAIRARGWDRQLERVAAHAPDNGGAVHVLVGHLARQQFPETDSEGPDVDLLVAGLVADDLRRHPGHGPRK